MSAFDIMLYAAGLFVGMLVLLNAGRRLGTRRLAVDAEGARTGVGAIEGSVFGLMGLLISFTFYGAAARFDSRRQLVVEEANAIGTAYLRLDLLPSQAQPALREKFRQYVDSRLEVYIKVPDIDAALAELARSNIIQGEIWNEAVAACQAKSDTATTNLLITALNQMIDITTTRTMAARIHPPPIIFALLGALSLATSLLAGYGMAGGKTRNWLHELGFAAILAVTVYVILDIEYPRQGLIRVDDFDQVLRDVRQSMK